MDVKRVRFYFEGGYAESEIVKKGFSLSEIYYNKLQAADGSVKLSIPFNIEIANLLKAEINQRVKAELFDSAKKVIYTGYLKQDVAFQKGQRNEPITLTVVSPSFYLDKELPRNIAIVNQSVNTIIQKVLTEIGFEEGIKNTGLNEFLPFFSAEKGESAKSILAQLCYEFGYVYYFDNLGRFSVRELFDDMPRDTKSIKAVMDGKVLLDKLKIQAKEHEADFVRATWQQVEAFQNTLVFSDTQGAEGNDKCRIKINSGWSMFATEEDGQGFLKINYCDFDSTKGKVLYVDGINADVVFDSGIDWNVTDIDTDGSRLCAKAIVTALNKSSEELYCRKLDIYAKQAYIATSTNECVSTTGHTAKEVELKYLYKKTQAEKFTERLANYYRYCNFTITAKSVKEYELGSFVKVEEYGTGTFYGRIIQKQYSLEKNAIEYKIETITDFTPATVDTTGHSNSVNAASSLRGEKGDAGRSGQDGATPYCYLEQASVTFSVDDVGKVEGIKYRIPIHCMVDNVELPFTIGEIEKKDGIKITPYEVKDEYNHVVEKGIDVETVKDYLLTAGSVTIPLVFTEVEHSYAYGDPEERIVIGVLEELLAYGEVALESADSIVDYKLPFTWAVQRLAIYRGAKKSIDGFLSPDTQVNLHRGDWFTWAGANHTKAVYNGVTVDFCTGGVYKWNGEYWEKDESVEHLSAALTDVLSVNDAMLKANNDKMELLLEKLANQQAFLDDLNNSVLPSMLANNARLNEELAKAEKFWKTLATNEDYEKLLSAQKTFATNLIDAQNGFQSHMAKAQTFYKELATNKDYEKLLSAQETFATNLIDAQNGFQSHMAKAQTFYKELATNKDYEKLLSAQETFATNLIDAQNGFQSHMAKAQTFYKELATNEQFEEKLAAEKVLAKTLVANDAFVNTLTSDKAFVNYFVAKQITADNAQISTQFVKEFIANKAIMDKLAVNEAFVQTLTANDAFVNTLTSDKAFVNYFVAKQITADNAQISTQFVKEFIANKAIMDKLAVNEAFVQTLTANDAFVKKLVAKDTFVENLIADYVSANSGVFKKVFLDALIGNKAFLKEIASDKAFVQELIATTINADTATMASAFIGALTANEAMMKSIATDKEFAKYFMSNKLVMKADPTDAELDGSMRSQTFDDTDHTAGWEIKQNGDATFYNMNAVGGKFKDIIATGGEFNNITVDKSSILYGSIKVGGTLEVDGVFNVDFNHKLTGKSFTLTGEQAKNTKWTGLDPAGSHYKGIHFTALYLSQSENTERSAGNSTGWHTEWWITVKCDKAVQDSNEKWVSAGVHYFLDDKHFGWTTGKHGDGWEVDGTVYMKYADLEIPCFLQW